MKLASTYFLILFVSYFSFSQVGIGNTDPKAQLDISAGTTPSEKDGILIPRLDEFPTGVDTNQDGMLLFITGNGTPAKGFYYWDNDTVGWITLGKSNVREINDLWNGKTDGNGSSIFLGSGSGYHDNDTDNRNIGLGFLSLHKNISGENNTANGYESLKNNITGSRNIAYGNEALLINIAGSDNMAIGNKSLQINNSGNYNIALGTETLRSNTGGSHNTAIGFQSLFRNNSGLRNIAIGHKTLYDNLDGDSNIALGYFSLTNNTSGHGNIAIGFQSLFHNTIGQNNLAIGDFSLYDNITGSNNVAFGEYSLTDKETGNNNVAIGGYSLKDNINGSDNTALGTHAGSTNNGNLNVFIGRSAGSYETGSNKLYIENSHADEDNALIYGEFDNNILRTNSIFQIGNPTGTGYAFPTTDGTAGQVLSTDGNGQLNFTTIEDDADWYEEGTTTAPNSITDNIYTQGNVAIDGQAYISNKIGIGTGAENPDGFLEVRANNTTTQPNINVVDIGSSGARINFSNTTTTNGNTWTLFGDTNNTSSSSLFHLFHTTTGNILTARGDGDVGIKGTPDTDFHIFHGNSGTADGFKLQNSTDNTWWRFYISSGTDDLRLYNSNNGTTMMGAFNDATGAYTSTSDRRLKKDLKELHFSWNTFMQLNPLTYKYKKDDLPTDYIGMIAQDVEKIYPQLVTYQEKEDIYHMDYAATGVVAIKAVQELKNEVNILEEKIENLATENTKLKAQLSKYQTLERRLIALERVNNKSSGVTEVSKGKK